MEGAAVIVDGEAVVGEFVGSNGLHLLRGVRPQPHVDGNSAHVRRCWANVPCKKLHRVAQPVQP